MVKNPLTHEEVMQLGDKTSQGVRGLLNKKSAAYKKSQIEEQDLSDDKIVEFLADNPRAIRRPLLTDGERVVIGFQEDEMKQLL